MKANWFFVWFFYSLVLVACDDASDAHNQTQQDEIVKRDPQFVKDSIAEVQRDSVTASYMKTFNLVDILSVDPTIKVDLRYATSNNFMGHVLYDTINRLYLQEDVAVRISACQKYLKSKHPNYSLLIYDGVRPLEVQREMWNAP